MHTTHTHHARPARGRLLAAIVIVLATVLSAPSLAQGRAARRVANIAAIVDRRAGPPAHRVAWAVHKLDGGGTAKNVATAQARCSGCRATAIAMEVVLVSHLSGQLNVVNQAGALNLHCSACAADAYAYQLVVASTTKVSITASGWQQLQAQVGRLVALARSGANPATMRAGVDAVAYQVVAILQAEVRVTGASPAANGLTQGAAPAPRGGLFQVTLRRHVMAA